MVICLERGADLHMAQLMPLPLTVSCFSKIQICFTFLVPAHLGSPAQRAVKRVCVWLYNLWTCRNVVDLLWTSGRRCSKPVLLYICSEFHLLGNHCCCVGTLYNKSTTTNRGSGVWALLRPRRELYRERKCADNYNNTINLFLKTHLASAFR